MFIVQGRAENAESKYICKIKDQEHRTEDRTLAYAYDSLSEVLAVVAVFNRHKPFHSSHLTFSWEPVNPDFLTTFVKDENPDESFDPEELKSGWSIVLGLFTAFVLALLYVAMMLNRPAPFA